MLVPFRKAGPVEEHIVPRVPPRRTVPPSLPGFLFGPLCIGQNVLLSPDHFCNRKSDGLSFRFERRRALACDELKALE